MDPDSWISGADRRRRVTSVPHVVVAMLVGVVFALAVALAAALPAVAAASLVLGFELREVVAVLVLWAASATVSAVVFVAISRTYVRTVLRRFL